MVTGDVKLTCNVQVPPMETIWVSGITTVNSHTHTYVLDTKIDTKNIPERVETIEKNPR